MITTAPSRLDFIADTNIYIMIGVPSIKIRSIRGMTASNCFRSCGASERARDELFSGYSTNK